MKPLYLLQKALMIFVRTLGLLLKALMAFVSTVGLVHRGHKGLICTDGHIGTPTTGETSDATDRMTMLVDSRASDHYFNDALHPGLKGK